jgi:RNase P/RNase MRP subunit p30
MIDIVMPRIGTEREFITTAQELGFTQILLLYKPTNAKKLSQKEIEELKKSEISVHFGLICENTITLPGFDYLIGLGTKISGVFGGLTHVLNNENEEEKDFVHQRRSGLNQVVLAEFSAKGIVVLSGLDQLRKKYPQEQAKVLGRMMQNAKLCMKKGITYNIVSLAKEPYEMKSAKDLHIFSQQLQ